MTWTPIAKGIRKSADGYQIYGKVRGEFVSQRFPPGTDESSLAGLRKTMMAQAELGVQGPAQDDEKALAYDVKEYLKAKVGMPTYNERVYQMEWWREQLGRRRERSTITSLEIRQKLAALGKQGKANGTLNKYRAALMDFFNIINGKSAANPVRDVPKYREEVLPLDLPTVEDIEKALACMPDWKTAPPEESRLRLRVLMCTGWPNERLRKVRPQDIHWKDSAVTVHGRKKGGGTKARTLPVSSLALGALRAFADAKLFGDFDGHALLKAYQVAQGIAEVRRHRVYDLRHLFITTVVLKSGDQRGASELAGHSSPQQTIRYSLHAASTRAKAALDAAFGDKKTGAA